MIKNLIIKSSFSKIKNGQLKSNLGDLVRGMVLLNCIEGKTYWLTDKRAVCVLKWFMDKDNIITFEDGVDQYKFSDVTRIYNLDNYVFGREIYKKLQGNWYGYIWDGKYNTSAANELIEHTQPYTDGINGLSWQEALVSGMGFDWSNQDYPIAVCQNSVSADVGLNWHVHPGWESKRWPREKWQKLEKVLSKTKSVSWQRGLDNFDEYIKWLSSCRLIVTCNTLGMHLASALRKSVVAIIGAVDSKEFSYGRVYFVKPRPRECMPCNRPTCEMEMHCISEISAESVSEVVLTNLQ